MMNFDDNLIKTLSEQKYDSNTESEIKIILNDSQWNDELDFFAFTCIRLEYKQIFNENIQIKNIIAH